MPFVACGAARAWPWAAFYRRKSLPAKELEKSGENRLRAELRPCSENIFPFGVR
jgi:hypothetical protein